MSNDVISAYFSAVRGRPFFYFVGDKEYKIALEELMDLCGEKIAVSDFCHSDDRFPDIDEILSCFLTTDVNYNSNRLILVGLGEYLSLRGRAEAEKVLYRLKDFNLGSARVVILLRGLAGQAEKLNSDIRLQSQNRVYISNNLSTDIRIVQTKVDFGLCKEKGIRALLRQFEEGKNGQLFVDTDLLMSDSIFPITEIKTPFSAIKTIIPSCKFKEEWGDYEEWGNLLKDLIKNHNSFDNLIRDYGFDYNEINDSGDSHKNWLWFIYAKTNIYDIKNSYLRYVLEHTTKFSDFKNNILTLICDISHNVPDFNVLYRDRKKIVKHYRQTDIRTFIQKNHIDSEEEIYKLTDNTLIEKQKIIDWIANNEHNEIVFEIYPDLKMYMKKYQFNCGHISSDLTEYFDLYKRQKLYNHIDDDFVEKVPNYSIKYTALDTRENVLALLKNDDSNVFLYWVDALGVEYLSYITELAKENNLNINVNIVRVELPTLTEVNKGFFDTWDARRRYKEERLDEIKHNEEVDYDLKQCHAPIYLARELEIIRETIGNIKNKLVGKKCDKVVLTSDHGASRLAVLCDNEAKVPTETKGEHSGRCCKAFEGCDVVNVIEEKGYLVLTDYSRFQGSRKANVEVHGGASLEETVVPIITFSFNDGHGVDIKILNNDNIFINRKKGFDIKIYISYVENFNNIGMVINGKKYDAMTTYEDLQHFQVHIDDIFKAGIYDADIFDGDKLIGMEKINIKNKLASDNSVFDDLFGV